MKTSYKIGIAVALGIVALILFWPRVKKAAATSISQASHNAAARAAALAAKD